jgi:hypothetical protein
VRDGQEFFAEGSTVTAHLDCSNGETDGGTDDGGTDGGTDDGGTDDGTHDG